VTTGPGAGAAGNAQPAPADPNRAIAQAPIQTVLIAPISLSEVTFTLAPFNDADPRRVPAEADL
jgi:hypothetical protein